MRSVTLRGDYLDTLRSIPVVGGSLANAAVTLKAAAELELKKRLTPYFGVAIGLGALGTILGIVAIVRTRKRG